MAKPSTQWRENVTLDEPDRFAKEVEIAAAIQRDRSTRYGHDGRTFHRKQLLAVRAVLRRSGWATRIRRPRSVRRREVARGMGAAVQWKHRHPI